MFNVKSGWGAYGVMLGLIALYLVLTNSPGFVSIIRATAAANVSIFRTLQGR
jgi:hypothetical protein